MLPRRGDSINIRSDHWLPSVPNFIPAWREDNIAREEVRWVADLVSFGQWNVGLIRELFDEESAEAIL